LRLTRPASVGGNPGEEVITCRGIPGAELSICRVSKEGDPSSRTKDFQWGMRKRAGVQGEHHAGV